MRIIVYYYAIIIIAAIVIAYDVSSVPERTLGYDYYVIHNFQNM